jgi:NADPH2:quinone reductase
MTKAVVIETFGDPSVLKVIDVSLSDPKPNEVQIRNTVIEVNFIDIMQRNGTSPLGANLKIPGASAVGEIVKLGPNVEGFSVGDRVAYTTFLGGGTYCETRNVNTKLVMAIPPTLDDKTIASNFFKGITAHTLACRTFIARPNCSILIHAAAGGVGRLLAQWCKFAGAYVIGTVGSETKKSIALDHGCDLVINYEEEDWIKKIREATSGIGVNAVYDSVGKNTFLGSLECLMNMGTMILYGTSSGIVEETPSSLFAAKSLFLTTPLVSHYKSNRMELLLGFNELCERFIEDGFKSPPPTEFSLSNCAEAHKLIESRQNLSSVILIP